MDKVLPVPSQFNETEVTTFLNKLFNYIDTPKVGIDFSFAEFVYPYGTLLSALGIKHFVKERNKRGFPTLAKVSDDGADSYLKFFGYFKFIGLDSGNEPSFEPSTDRYLPLTIIKKKQLLTIEKKIHPAIERKSYSLAKTICPGLENEKKTESLTYCFREIIRNVFEHAETDECILMAQRWKNGFAEIGIADHGIGVFKSLSPAHLIRDADDAIELALNPGISRLAESKSKDKWKNSGYGLFVLSELGRKFGSFSITSSGRLLLVGEQSNWLNFPCDATAIKLRLNLNAIEDFSAELEMIIKAGESIASTDERAIKHASGMSKVSK